MNHDPIIIALDVSSTEEADDLVERLGPSATFYKVGMELFAASGPDYVERLIDRGKRVFLDLKYYDIGETVRRAVAVVALRGAAFLTVHAVPQVMRAAVEGRGDSSLKLLAVTVLTSLDENDLAQMGHRESVGDLVRLRVHHAVECGIDGIVGSALEARSIRSAAGPDKLLVTPGVRSRGAQAGDQKRVATPAEALRDGSDYVVIGRQVTRAADPASEVESIREEIRKEIRAQPAASE
jgi:orotidine-5'-phosphate decarboxylase